MFYTSFTSRLFYCSTPHLSLDYFTVLHLLYLQTILLFYTSFISRLFYCYTPPLSLHYFTVLHLLTSREFMFYTYFTSYQFYCSTPPLPLINFTVLHLISLKTILLFSTSNIAGQFYCTTIITLKSLYYFTPGFACPPPSLLPFHFTTGFNP